MNMKRCCLLFCMMTVMALVACGSKQEHLSEETEESVLWDRRPMVMVNGEIYLDTGTVSDITARCGMMDGEITSEVDGSEIPTKDDQSNFGTGYGYQYVDENSIDIFLPYGSDSDDMRWIRFEKEKTTAEEYGEEDILLTSAPAFILKDVLSDEEELVEIRSGNFFWNSKNGEGMTGVNACGSHPLYEAGNEHAASLKLPEYNGMDSVPYSFSCQVLPDELTVREWSAEDIGSDDAEEISVTTFDDSTTLLELKAGKVYEFTAVWEEANLEQRGFFGSASYVLKTE